MLILCYLFSLLSITSPCRNEWKRNYFSCNYFVKGIEDVKLSQIHKTSSKFLSRKPEMVYEPIMWNLNFSCSWEEVKPNSFLARCSQIVSHGRRGPVIKYFINFILCLFSCAIFILCIILFVIWIMTFWMHITFPWLWIVV